MIILEMWMELKEACSKVALHSTTVAISTLTPLFHPR